MRKSTSFPGKGPDGALPVSLKWILPLRFPDEVPCRSAHENGPRTHSRRSTTRESSPNQILSLRYAVLLAVFMLGVIPARATTSDGRSSSNRVRNRVTLCHFPRHRHRLSKWTSLKINVSSLSAHLLSGD
jgi:hypothetical protein